MAAPRRSSDVVAAAPWWPVTGEAVVNEVVWRCYPSQMQGAAAQQGRLPLQAVATQQLARIARQTLSIPPLQATSQGAPSVGLRMPSADSNSTGTGNTMTELRSPVM